MTVRIIVRMMTIRKRERKRNKGTRTVFIVINNNNISYLINVFIALWRYSTPLICTISFY